MDSSTFILFLILIGLAFTSGNQTLVYVGVGVGAIFLVLMGGAHHIIIAVIALGIVYVGSQSGNETYMLYSLLIAGVIFIIFVLHGKENEAGGGMEAYGGMGGLGLPMGY